MLPIARLGDVHDCPIHGTNKIVEGGNALVDGMPIARLGDACGCGGKIVEATTSGTDDGKPVAYLGCKTSCGGKITTGSSSHMIEP